MVTEESLIWQNETSVWFQQVSKTAQDTYLLRREYTRDPVDLGGAVASPAVTTGAGATLIESARDPRWPGVDLYELRSDRQLALVVLNANAEEPSVTECFVAVGSLLAAMHQSDVVGTRRAFHAVRFQEVLSLPESGSPSSRLKAKLSGPLLSSIQGWLHELTSATRGVPSLGNASMNSIFFDESGRVEMPYGPEACTAPPEFDVGWLLGELTELEYSFTQRGMPSAHIPRYARTLLDSYERAGGVELDLARLARVVAVRTCLHYFDFSETMPTVPIGEADIAFLEWLIERAQVMEDDDGER